MSAQKTVSKKKVETVNGLVDKLSNFSTIGLVAMESIGAKTVQKLRSDLRGRAEIVVAKNTLMKRALEDSKVIGWEELSNHVKGPSAFLFTNNSPYQIANYLDKNKVKAPAKAGAISPISVTIPKMNTGFPPGTVISELNSVGLPTRIEGGTVAIPQDTQVLEPGDKISATLASILTRIGIEPFMVGLSLDVVLENGSIIDHDGLVVDFDEYREQLMYAYQSAFNLAVNAGILNGDTAPLVISKAKQDAIALASAIGYITEDTAPSVLGRANSLAIALGSALAKINSDAVPENFADIIPSTTTSQTAKTEIQQQEDEVADDEEEEEGEILDEDEGLGSLFG